MTKIEKTDIENIKTLEKELKSRDLSSIKSMPPWFNLDVVRWLEIVSLFTLATE